MHFTSASSLVCVLFAAGSVVNAHFNITYPPVRGPFDDNNEVNFCGEQYSSEFFIFLFLEGYIYMLTVQFYFTDSYVNAGVRALFPLTNGLITFIDSHPQWVGTMPSVFLLFFFV
jgi:hypothetical protein